MAVTRYRTFIAARPSRLRHIACYPSVTMRVVAGLAALIISFCSSCGQKLPRPPSVPQPDNALTEIPYPPPPGRVEMVPPRPSSDVVWINGQWKWSGRRWAWERGAWVVPPAGAAYAPWSSVQNASGALLYVPGTWRDRTSKQEVAPKKVETEGRSTSGPVVNPEGEDEETAPNQNQDGGIPFPGRSDGAAP